MSYHAMRADGGGGHVEVSEYVCRAYLPSDEDLTIDPFTRAYLECAEFCGIYDEDQRRALESLGYGEAEWDRDSIKRALRDCLDFQASNQDDLNADDSPGLDMAGHDFYLTRNGHGAGFWDGDWSDAAGKRLTENSRPYGETGVYFDAETNTLHLESC